MRACGGGGDGLQENVLGHGDSKFALVHCGRRLGQLLSPWPDWRVRSTGEPIICFSCSQFFRGNCSMYRCRFSVFVKGSSCAVILDHLLKVSILNTKLMEASLRK